MKHINRVFAAFLVVLLFVLLSACASNLVALAVTPMPKATDAPSPTPSPEPTEVPAPAVDEYSFTVERKAELNQQFQDFVNYQGEYSKENIKKYLLPTYDECFNLGLITSGNTYNMVQAWLFDYVEKDGDLLLIVGFDDINGQRFVTASNISLHFISVNPNIGVSFSRISEWDSNTKEQSAGRSGDLDTITGHLFRNSPLLIDFVSNIASDDEARKLGGDAFVAINQYYRHNVSYMNDLISRLDQNGMKIIGSLETNGKKIEEINEISDIFKLENANIPIVGAITYVG